MGRTILITGANGGLGQALVAKLAAKGHSVIATDISSPEAAGLPEARPGARFERLDVTDAQACRTIAERFTPDVWINNAGVLHPGPAASQPDEEVRRVIEVTLLGTMNGTRAAVAVMPDGGHIINIASLAAWIPVPGEGVYAAAKAGVLSFSLSLRAELHMADRDDIAISVICPDGMLTPMITEHLDNPHVSMSFSGVRTVTPEEVADIVISQLARPKPVVCVPYWRGALARVVAAVPDRAHLLAKPFIAVGERNRRRQQRAAASAPHR